MSRLTFRSALPVSPTPHPCLLVKTRRKTRSHGRRVIPLVSSEVKQRRAFPPLPPMRTSRAEPGTCAGVAFHPYCTVGHDNLAENDTPLFSPSFRRRYHARHRRINNTFFSSCFHTASILNCICVKISHLLYPEYTTTEPVMTASDNITAQSGKTVVESTTAATLSASGAPSSRAHTRFDLATLETQLAAARQAEADTTSELLTATDEAEHSARVGQVFSRVRKVSELEAEVEVARSLSRSGGQDSERERRRRK